MIKTSELRLGNLFMAPGNLLAQVIEIKPGYAICKAGNLTFLLASVEPIRITPEWLIRLGASRAKHTDLYSVGYNGDSVSVDFGRRGIVTVTQDRSHHIHLRNMEYIHQVQNLYFALTGEELRITLP